ncbi:CHAT domain-containing protein [Xylaria scruposa]|nr:CHAT domain-containing protein [Xylaria scruposa]
MLIQDILDLKAAISYLEAVEHLGNAPIIIMFRAKRRLLVMYLWTGNRQRIAKAAADAVTLVSKLSPRWHELADKQHMLQTEIAMVGVEAASTALEAGWSPYTALSSFEESRCVHAMSLEDLRADVRDLRQKNPRLAEQYVLLCDQLDAPASSTMTTTPPSKTSHNTQRHKSWEDLDNILNQIRQEPGFEEFLLPPSEPKIRAAAKQGPIVVIVVSEMNCDAILVEPQRIRSIRLHDLRLDDINVRGRGESLGCPGVLEWLWDAVAKPILDALGYIGPPRDSNTWPHIWWVPSGPLSKFPLHAAGYHMRNSNDTVLDRVISSYSPSVKAIVQGRHSDHPRTASSTRPVKALLIALENTPGVPERLPFAGREATMLRTLCQSMSIEVIEPDRCRKSDVLAHLPKCDFFHFAGHGHTDPNPSQSHLMVEDWAKDKLTVASLLDLNLRARRPFLAYLSACGTGEIREDYLFDESLHLINGCQLAGFRHVIGTLWEVNDEVCVEMARLTYEGIRDGGITDESVSRALHIASRKMRQQWRQQENMGSQKKKRGKGREGSGVSVRGENCRGQTTMPPSSACDTQKLGFPRVVELVDDDDDDDYGSNKLIDDGEWTERPLWIPFVHFGV